jgi:hypothetical protein
MLHVADVHAAAGADQGQAHLMTAFRSLQADMQVELRNIERRVLRARPLGFVPPRHVQRSQALAQAASGRAMD